LNYIGRNLVLRSVGDWQARESNARERKESEPLESEYNSLMWGECGARGLLFVENTEE
jgi:hypothetical protein